VGRNSKALIYKRAQGFDLRWIAVLLLGLVLAWFVVPHSTVDADVRGPVRLHEGSPHRAAVSQAPAVAILHVNTVGVDACENEAVHGAHSATTLEAARDGAAEDIRDVCPSNQVAKVIETCSAHMAEDVDGVAQQMVRCQRSGMCRICGEHLARRRELIGAQ